MSPSRHTHTLPCLQLCASLRGHGICVDCVVLPREGAAKEGAAGALRRCVDAAPGGSWADTPAHGNLLRAGCAKAVGPTTTMRVSLQLGPWLSVGPLFVFKGIDVAKAPTFRGELTAPNPDAPGGPPVVMRLERKTDHKKGGAPPAAGGQPGAPAPADGGDDDDNGYVAPEGKMKAYRYGKDVTPITKSEEEAMRFRFTQLFPPGTPAPADTEGWQAQPPPSDANPVPEGWVSAPVGKTLFELVGFTPRASLPRHYCMKHPEHVFPGPSKDHPSGVWANPKIGAQTAARAAAALSALSAALRASHSVAVVRVKPRAHAEVHLGVLSPGHNDECLVLNTLPFAEDCRAFDFAPLPPPDRPHLAPSAGANAAATMLVNAMMFPQPRGDAPAAADADPLRETLLSLSAPDGGAAAFGRSGDCRLLHNPMLRRVHALIKARALDADAPIPPWGADHVPAAVGGEAAATAAAAFAAAAPTAAPRAKPGRSAAASAAAGGAGGGAAGGDGWGGGGDKAFGGGDDSGPAPPTGGVDPDRPAEDFEARVAAAGGDADALLDAVRAVCVAIYEAAAYSSSRFPLMLSALASLRRVCVTCGLLGTYAHVVENMFERCKGVEGGGAWAAMQAHGGLGPITASEAPGHVDAVSEGEAAARMASDAAAAAPDAEEGDTQVAGGAEEEALDDDMD